MRPSLLFATLALGLATSCSERQATEQQALGVPSAQKVDSIATLCFGGDYAALVGTIHSCDSLPHASRQQMAILFKQHAAETAEAPVLGWQIDHIEAVCPGQSATAMLRLNFAGGRTEAVQLPLVCDDGTWRLR